MVNQSFQEAVALAKTRLYRNKDWTFIASLCSRLITKEFNEGIGATDGKHLLLNPDIFIGLSKEHQMFLLAHETLHVAYLHMIRKGNRNHLKWNMATDYAINQHLIDSGFSMIEGGLYDKKYTDMSSEQIYDLLPDVKEFPMEDIIYSDEVQEFDITSNVISASVQAKMNGSWGNVPEHLRRAIDELTKPKINWRVVLNRFIKETVKDNYTWLRPNRRMLPNHILMPSLHSKGLGKISFAIDVSSSVDDGMFTKFISEIHHVLNQTKPKELELVMFNTEIISKHSVKNTHELSCIKFDGYGGTDVAEVIEYANKEKPQALIIITDGYFPDNYNDCQVPLLWVIYDNASFKPKKGKGVVINYAI